MAAWSYRVIKTETGCCGIREVYYDENDEVESWTEDEVGVWGEDYDELKRTYKMMAEAFDEPVLLESELLKKIGEDGQIDNRRSCLESEEDEDYDSPEGEDS